MYNFILNMWITGRITESTVQTYVTKGFITQDEANMILATPKL